MGFLRTTTIELVDWLATLDQVSCRGQRHLIEINENYDDDDRQTEKFSPRLTRCKITKDFSDCDLSLKFVLLE